jgi:predicted ribosome quality control (RQC) complex YloA/Tae2 family protein
VFSKKDFQAWGKQNVVLFAAVMTKIEGRKDDELLRTYEFRGFPSMAILDAEGGAVTKEIPRDLFSMQNIVASAPSYVKLAAAAEAGEQVDAKAWYLAQLGMGKLSVEEAKAQLATVGLAADAKVKAEQIVFVMEMNDLSRSSRGRGATAEDKMAACEAVYEAFKAGKRVPAGSTPEQFVDDMLIDAAKSSGDAKAFFFAYDRVKARHQERIEQMEGFVTRYEADLEKNKDDPKLLERTQSTLKRIGETIDETKKQIEELDALAKKLKG